jgi:hypothetical protein
MKTYLLKLEDDVLMKLKIAAAKGMTTMRQLILQAIEEKIK